MTTPTSEIDRIAVDLDEADLWTLEKDIPTPEHDALFGECNEKPLLDELCMVYELAYSLEQRLAIAVAALRKIEINDDCYESAPIAKEALAQIEEKK
jgi:hypothetical protein